MTRWAAFLACLALVFGAFGCGSDDPRRFENPTGPIEVEEGESFEIALGANTSTGYEWQPAGRLPSDVVRYDGSDYVPDPGSEDEDGGGGEQVLSFTSTGRGEATIDLQYVFSGGEDRDPADETSVDLTVR